MPKSQLPPLPIDAHLPALVAALRARPNLVLVAEPGAGKTTRVPRALLDAGFADQGEILVLQPRRIATRLAARRVAQELGQEVGDVVGYQVRFENVGSARTRIRFVTEGILTRRLVDDPQLRKVAAVVLDEFHERHLHADLGLALLRKLQRERRPELRIIVMSATLAAEPLASFLDTDVHSVAGRPYPVEIQYAAKPSDTPLEQRVAQALRGLIGSGLEGDVLTFLPGAAEIRRAQEACQDIVRDAGMELAVLHGDLSARDQDRAVEPGARRKLILSTNVAETSLTIEGVRAVIDSGLARVAGHSPFSGLPTLNTAAISRASAEQRAGRAGRMGPGRCVRLYTKHEHDARPEHDAPEIAREDLAETRLSIAASGFALAQAEWFEPPPSAAWRAAHELLSGLGAMTAEGELTELGKRMAGKPLHPRLSRLVFEAQTRGVGDSGCMLAALLGERDVLVSARARFDRRDQDVSVGRSDLVHRLELIESLGHDRAPGRMRGYGLDAGATSAVLRSHERLKRQFGDVYDDHALDDAAREEALLIATCAAFFDRVAKRRTPQGATVVFARGGSANLAETCVVRDAAYLVVVDARESKGKREAIAYLASAIEPEWLLELFPDRIRDQTTLGFDRKTERVSAIQELSYEGLVLDSASHSDVSGPDVSARLVAAAEEQGIEKFFDLEAVNELRARSAWAAAIDPQCQPLPDDVLTRALHSAAEGKKSFAELRQEPLFEYVHLQLPSGQRAKLASLAPEHVELPHGRRLRVHYERDKPPWVESRLQDFFGMKVGPTCGQRPIVLHLLAPNQRPVQVTTDLAGFWQRHYPDIRRELMRRYPRHAWPDDPVNATPPPKPPPRPRR
ncbi:MAG: ATP-dependent helicase HrpB [Polyangiales bacterium]